VQYEHTCCQENCLKHSVGKTSIFQNISHVAWYTTSASMLNIESWKHSSAYFSSTKQVYALKILIPLFPVRIWLKKLRIFSITLALKIAFRKTSFYPYKKSISQMQSITCSKNVCCTNKQTNTKFASCQ